MAEFRTFFAYELEDTGEHILETTTFLTNGIFSTHIYCNQIKEKVIFSTDNVFKKILGIKVVFDHYSRFKMYGTFRN